MVSVLPHECFEDGWSAFGTNCYKVIPAGDDGINWFDAQKGCESLGSNLASIHDQNEQDYIFSLVKSASFVGKVNGPWIGLNRTAPHSQIWQWSDGTSFDFFYWSPGQPDDSGTADGEACVQLSFGDVDWNVDNVNNLKDLGWNDNNCLFERYGLFHLAGYVCKKRKPPQI